MTGEAGQAARRLVPQTRGHKVISLYLDLDPERFATAPARASQIRSLLDEGSREIERQRELSHEDSVALREDLARIEEFLSSREPPLKGARALAVFCSSRDELFETVQLPRGAESRVVIADSPYIEPLVAALQERRWMVLLASRRSARILTGPAERLRLRRELEEDVHGQHDQGGWSQANYERSVEKDADDHLRRVAETAFVTVRRERIDRVALGGPPEIVPRLEGMLHAEVRARSVPDRVEVDLSRANEDEIRRAVRKLVDEDEKRLEREALNRLANGIGSGARATGGPQETVVALNERRVETLLLEPGFDGRAKRCSVCGQLLLSSEESCPADGSEVDEVEHLREAVVEAALAQDADVRIVRHYPDLGPLQGIGALLRF